MGGRSSKSRRPNGPNRNFSHGQSSHGRYANYTDNYVPPSTVNRVRQKYSQIGDDFVSLDQVTDALAQAGLESSNLIVGIDFTKSNEWTGKNSFQRRCLHALGGTSNPYEQAISIIGRSLAKFDDDNLIPCFGFGDASTHDQEVFSFYADHRPCDGFEEALQRYRDLVPNLRLAGPTSFAPIIETAIGIVDNSGGQYHVLLIIADGQVTRSVDMELGQLSPQERDTINAIVKASDYPLSIVLVGVGDGPWDTMKQFDDNIPSRAFDNFQYKATMDLQLLGKRKGVPERFYLPPPIRNQNQTYASPKPSQGGSSQYTAATNYKSTDASPSSGQSDDRQDCPICWAEAKNLAFGCGHQTCAECGKELRVCPICQRQITTRIKLY
ncbi:E3 ubiquitin-protein ligase RGLG2-like isoform X1 [Carex littledalei]|uniref:E3 ubiquitin-protein ligase RGLG2-like isoform X1 n=1 Tax=Carex littledalei TaxID=544730 RepID=A0A833QX76_9POAL|nr:E3 ubiquitin-protein ligase RGLG2-like isoform X1 [Carex littledalei]